MLIHNGVELFGRVVYAYYFQCCECVEVEWVARFHVERVFLHTIVFFGFNSRIYQRLIVDKERRCGDDANAGMSGDFLQLVGNIEHPDSELLILLDLEDVSSESAIAVSVQVLVVFDREKYIDWGANGYKALRIRLNLGFVDKSKYEVSLYFLLGC